MMADYLEGALTPVVKAACEVHLIGCDRCREKLAAFMRILQPEVTAEENAAVDAVVADRPRPRVAGGGGGWWKRAYTYTAIAVVVLLALILGRSFFTANPDDLIRNVRSTFRPFEARL